MLQRSLLLSAAVSGGAHALAVRQDGSCSFHCRAEGAVSAPVGQYSSGQTRAGPNETASSFFFRVSDGAVADGEGRGCRWTPPAMVLQCDVGQVPEAGFGIGCDGAVGFRGQTTFYGCDTGADGLYMIYLGPPHGSRCGEIALRADGCYPAGCGGGSGAGGLPLGALTSSWMVWTYPTGTSSPGSSGTSSLPLAGLASSWMFLTSPTGGGGGGGTTSSSLPLGGFTSSWDFAYPAGGGAPLPTAVFYLPRPSQLETSSYNLTGSGALRHLAGRGAYTVASFACLAGRAVAFAMGAARGDASTALRYFQDYNPCPIGLFIAVS
ncbi:ubiquitin 3 binding protein But2 C-terminal domain-containing protein [Ustulina deusta]|nr:ubiquitin 3 binding protein But2 C-terminal domain-containing protein [Ustulina deusta]